jgi:hypothetical protein
MNNDVLKQLAHTNLLSPSMSTAILAGNTPPLAEIINSLVTAAWDAEAMTSCDPKSTWNERRIARACLSVAFLTAISCTREEGIVAAEQKCSK